MLKLEELSAFNWVQYCGKPLQIRRFINDYAYFEGHTNLLVDVLHPLPITPETLALLGITKELPMVKGWYEYDSLQIKLHGDCASVFNNQQIILSVRYIHELQNLCTLLGITLTPTKP